ncbi:MAG: histidinol-phosphate aminotransferase family protein [Clostridia bacterium]|nr:histidinol-phosphate aminotransferase family protein [Clostridia bacterium]
MERKSAEITERYRGITRYAGVPTEQNTGRLHYNENIYGPSPLCLETLKETTPEDLCLYESGSRDDLVDALSEKFGIPAENIFLGNGSAENLRSMMSIFTKAGDTVLLPDPGWSYYTGLADCRFLRVERFPIKETEDACVFDLDALENALDTLRPALTVIANPAMPTGNGMDDATLEDTVKNHPGTLFIIDEAYFGFKKYTLDVKRMIDAYDNVIFSRTFSKYYGLANLRVGYGFCCEALKKILWLDLPLHRLPHVCKRMAIAALRDDEYYGRVTAELIASRERFRRILNDVPGIYVYPSEANFVYIRLRGYDAVKIREEAAKNGYLIRVFDGSPEKHLRVTIGTKDVMEGLTELLLKLIPEAGMNN